MISKWKFRARNGTTSEHIPVAQKRCRRFALPGSQNWIVNRTLRDIALHMPAFTMAVSLEARSPFLDHEFVELAAALPSAVKARGGESKLALRAAFRGVVPDQVLDGPKRGFSIPLDSWFRHELAPAARALIGSSSSAVGRVLRPQAITRLLDQHESGRRHHGVRIFALVWLELWFRTYIDSPPPLDRPAEVALADLA